MPVNDLEPLCGRISTSMVICQVREICLKVIIIDILPSCNSFRFNRENHERPTVSTSLTEKKFASVYILNRKRNKEQPT